MGLHVVRHVRPRLASKRCSTILQAPAPSRPIDRCLAGTGLLTHVLVSKYCDHTPLYRLCQIYGREGVPLQRSTLADWVAQAARLLSPLAQAIGRYVLAAEKIHGDATGPHSRASLTTAASRHTTTRPIQPAISALSLLPMSGKAEVLSVLARTHTGDTLKLLAEVGR